MKKLALLLLSAAIGAGAQNVHTVVTAANINDGVNPVTGRLCVVPVSSSGQPQGYKLVSGGQIAANPHNPPCVAITAGALPSGFQVPDMLTGVSPSPGLLAFEVFDSQFNQIRTDLVQPTGTTWSYDAFVPGSSPTVQTLNYLASLNGISNAANATIVAGAGINVTTSGSAITVANTGSGSSPTASTIDTAIAAQTGCSTAGYVWVPQSNTCVAQSSGSGSGTVGTGSTGQLAYYAANGTAVAPLALGTNLSITAGTLNAASGGSGTVGGGTTGQIPYYASNGSALSAESLLQCVNMPADAVGDLTSAGGTCADAVVGINGVNLATTFSGGAGLLKISTAGAPSKAVAGTDYQAALGYTPLNAANNLSDVASAATALANLGAAPASGSANYAPKISGVASSATYSLYHFYAATNPLNDLSANAKSLSLATNYSTYCVTTTSPALTAGLGASFTAINGSTNQCLGTPFQTVRTFAVLYTTQWAQQTTGIAGAPSANQPQPCILCASTTSDGFLLSASGVSNLTNNATAPTFLWYDYGGGTTAAQDAFGETHSFILTCPSSGTPTFYVDGQNIGAYAINNPTSPLCTTTGYFLLGDGYNNNSSRGLGNWIMHSVAIDSGTAWTAAQAAAWDASERQQAAAANVLPVAPLATFLAGTPTVTLMGDSLIAGYQGTTQPFNSTYIKTYNTYQYQNWGQSSESLRDICSAPNNLGLSSVNPALGAQNIVIVRAGTNDTSLYGATPATIGTAAAKCVAAIHKTGARAVFMDMISRTGYDTNKDALNPVILGQYKAWGFDALIDIAEAPGVGADGTYSNACFASDHVHESGPTGVTTCTGTPTYGSTGGYNVAADSMATIINYLDSPYTLSNPHAVSGTTYTMVTGAGTAATAFDKVINPTCASGTCAITLPPCDFMDDMPVTVMDVAQAGTITAAAPTGYNLNGSTSAVTLTKTSTFTELRGTMAAGGCSWVQIQ